MISSGAMVTGHYHTVSLCSNQELALESNPGASPWSVTFLRVAGSRNTPGFFARVSILLAG
jgi:hypothetical protein